MRGVHYSTWILLSVVPFAVLGAWVPPLLAVATLILIVGCCLAFGPDLMVTWRRLRRDGK